MTSGSIEWTTARTINVSCVTDTTIYRTLLLFMHCSTNLKLLLIVCLCLSMLNECEKTTIRCAAWNMQSLSGGLAYLSDLLVLNDIVAISEHGAFNCKLWKLKQINNEFHVLAKSCGKLNDADCNIKLGHSGVALFWRASLDQYVKPLNDVSSDRICAIELCLPHCQRIVIASVYLPHRTSKVANYTDELKVLENLVDQAKQNGEIIILGDLNAHFGYEFGDRCWGDTSHTGHEFSRFAVRNNLEVRDIGPESRGPVYTFRSHVHGGMSYIDHCVISKELLCCVTKCWVYDDCIVNSSDHLPVGLDFQVFNCISENGSQNPSVLLPTHYSPSVLISVILDTAGR